MERRSYNVRLVVNGAAIKKVIIDPHYEVRHSASINDELILGLIGLLDGGDFDPEMATKDFEYFRVDDLLLNEKRYRLIWLMDVGRSYIGVVNAYRRKT